MGTPGRITADHLEHWQQHGYVVIEGFLTADELAAAQSAMSREYPTWDDWAADRPRYDLMAPWREFPFEADILNHLTAHPDVIAFVTNILGTPDVQVTQALTWAKYAGSHDFEQDLHTDFDNNTLVVPKEEGIFRQIPSMLYYSDVTIDLGPTRVVSQDLTRHLPLFPRNKSRDAHPELYEAELAVTVPAGSLLLYQMRTFHRGTAITATEGARFSHHIVWRAAGMEWMGWRAFPQYASQPGMVRFIESASVAQRSAIGFPPPGHPYWDNDTLDGVQQRYPGLDLSPYRAGLEL